MSAMADWKEIPISNKEEVYGAGVAQTREDELRIREALDAKSAADKKKESDRKRAKVVEGEK